MTASTGNGSRGWGRTWHSCLTARPAASTRLAFRRHRGRLTKSHNKTPEGNAMNAPAVAAAAAHEDPNVSATGGAVARARAVQLGAVRMGAKPYVLLITIYVLAPYSPSGRSAIRAGRAPWGDLGPRRPHHRGAGAALGRSPISADGASRGSRLRLPRWRCSPMRCGTRCPTRRSCRWWRSARSSSSTTSQFEFTAVFHNVMLPEICNHGRVGGLRAGPRSAICRADHADLSALRLRDAGSGRLSFIPAAPWFGIDQSAFEHERLSGPISAIWPVVFTLPMLFFTFDRAAWDACCGRSRSSVGRVFKTLGSLRHYQNVMIYLTSYGLRNDGKTAIPTFGGILVRRAMFGWGASTCSPTASCLGLCGLRRGARRLA